jgi:hypothetical protein
MSALLPEPPTWSDSTASKLTPTQDFRVRIARNDLEQARQLDSAAASNAQLLLAIGYLTSSLFNVLQLVDDLALVEP